VWGLGSVFPFFWAGGFVLEKGLLVLLVCAASVSAVQEALAMKAAAAAAQAHRDAASVSARKEALQPLQHTCNKRGAEPLKSTAASVTALKEAEALKHQIALQEQEAEALKQQLALEDNVAATLQQQLALKVNVAEEAEALKQQLAMFQVNQQETQANLLEQLRVQEDATAAAKSGAQELGRALAREKRTVLQLRAQQEACEAELLQFQQALEHTERKVAVYPPPPLFFVFQVHLPFTIPHTHTHTHTHTICVYTHTCIRVLLILLYTQVGALKSALDLSPSTTPSKGVGKVHELSLCIHIHIDIRLHQCRYSPRPLFLFTHIFLSKKKKCCQSA
jgi:hypothetical protein